MHGTGVLVRVQLQLQRYNTQFITNSKLILVRELVYIAYSIFVIAICCLKCSPVR